jgi:hypothetical protein
VRIVDGVPPKLSEVAFTSDCRISVHAAAPGRVVVFAALTTWKARPARPSRT